MVKLHQKTKMNIVKNSLKEFKKVCFLGSKYIYKKRMIKPRHSSHLCIMDQTC